MRTYHALFVAPILLLASSQQSWAQSADIPRHGSVTGLSDPEPAAPRFVKASELADLKDQVQSLSQAYGQLKRQQRKQANRILQLERTSTPDATGRTLPKSSLSLGKP